VNRPVEKLVNLAKKLGVELRQSYARVASSPYPASALRPMPSSSKRAPTGLVRTLKTIWAGVIRDTLPARSTATNGLEGSFAQPAQP